MDLFDTPNPERGKRTPLADRLRPVSLEEVVGQSHLLAPGKFLRIMIERDQVPSMILWGPPGTGKTTLASVIAKHTQSVFVFYSAVLGSVKEIRTMVEEARERKRLYGRKTILFVDEIHRFNKAQQDAFLPYVEKGIVTLIGATTENPSFEVNAALLSRARVVVLKPLADEEIALLVERALSDGERGLPASFRLDPEALAYLCQAAYGDARRALSTLEAASELALKEERSEITLPMVEEAMQAKALLYDKGGEEHYNVVSAFIKSMRGSDPDAAVYWMARMLEAGEDPMFVLRRMVIFASEDVGSADPMALQVAISAMQSFHFIGMPEGYLPMSQAATYLACAPKSNAALKAYQRASADIRAHGPLPVPLHIRNSPTKLMKSLGYGKGYQYPHDFEGNYVVDDYLPELLRGRRYYEPSDLGAEARIKARLEQWRLQRSKKQEEEDPR